MTKVEKAILQTLAFFDIFKRPLTLEELWHNLYRVKTSKIQVLFALRALQEKKIVAEKDSYYNLKNNPKAHIYFESNKLVKIKNWRKVNWVIKILKFAPFVKNISVINSLSFGASNQNSDIDILLIARKNRLWTARAFAVALLELIGQNKDKWHQAGKFCLGYAFDETQMNLEKIEGRQYILSSFWVAAFKPVFDRKIYQNFIRENQWLFKELPNWSPRKIEMSQVKLSTIERFLNGRFGDKLEQWLAKIQIKRVWSDSKNMQASKGWVIADTHMLKMHPYSKQLEYQDMWMTSCRKLLK